jgi:hypothetical protein
MTVGHGASEDQAGKGHFLIGDGIADFIFGHRWLRFREFEKQLGAEVSTVWGSRVACIKKPAGGGMLGMPYL